MTQPQMVTLGVVAAAVVVIGGGMAYAASTAEPGDMLYGLRASLYGDAGDADVEASLRGARDVYAEASDLEGRGALTASERARLTAEYSLHVNAVQRRIAELEASGDMDAAATIRADLRAVLREYRDIFPNVDDGTASSSSSSTNTSASSGMSAATSAGMSSDDDDGASSSATSIQGASSSIFVQPSSSVTSA